MFNKKNLDNILSQIDELSNTLELHIFLREAITIIDSISDEYCQTVVVDRIYALTEQNG